MVGICLEARFIPTDEGLMISSYSRAYDNESCVLLSGYLKDAAILLMVGIDIKTIKSEICTRRPNDKNVENEVDNLVDRLKTLGLYYG